LEPDTYRDFPTLCHNVTTVLETVLEQVGSKYRLSFA